MNRKLLHDLLEAQGHEVTLAEDGQQALEKALATLPDVVLLDIVMPKMDGFEVCRGLKADPKAIAVGQTCPNCGSPDLRMVEGCLTCGSCGHSKCG